MPEELTQDEKDRLKDIESFNNAIAAGGWHLADKIVHDSLSRIRLRDSEFAGVTFEAVPWRDAVITNSRFVRTKFVLCDFGGARLSGVTFTDCEFVNCTFSLAAFDNCRFVGCQSRHLKSRDAVYEKCSFERFDDQDGVFGGSKIRETRLVDCRLENTSLQLTELSRILIRKTELKLVLLGEITGTNLVFEESILRNCGFVDSEFGNLGFERCGLRGVTFDHFAVERAFFRAATYLEGVRLQSCRWKQPAISDCPQVSEFTCEDSVLGNWTMVRSQAAYLQFFLSTLTGGSAIEDCQIAGLSLAQSTVNGIRLENTVIHLALALDGARLERITLKGVEYAEDLHITDGGLVYVEAAHRFPTG
jgi:uncharacterized protein YjbI with pentapeptide repeats